MRKTYLESYNVLYMDEDRMKTGKSIGPGGKAMRIQMSNLEMGARYEGLQQS